jgi:sigma-E factor negative regulatory protein RseC
MIEQIGEIIQKKDKTAVVQIERHSACAKCGACHSGRGEGVVIEAENPINAGVGDRVKIEMAARNMMSAVLIVYIIPLLSLFIGMGIGYFFALKTGRTENTDIIALGFGGVFFIITFFLIYRYDKKIAKKEKYRPVIRRILQ